MTSAPLKVAVIGAGIGGLTAALSLRSAGFAVEVYERAPELTEVGGGINMGQTRRASCAGSGLPKGLTAKGYARSARTSGVGRTDAPCSARRSIHCARSYTARRT